MQVSMLRLERGKRKGLRVEGIVAKLLACLFVR